MKDKINNFWNNKKLTDEEKNEKLIETCQRVFSTDDGKIVLGMLLTDLRLFKYSSTDTERERILNDYAKFFIRERLGISETKSLTDFIAQTAFETAVSGGGK